MVISPGRGREAAGCRHNFAGAQPRRSVSAPEHVCLVRESLILCFDTLAPYGHPAVHLRDPRPQPSCSVSSIAGAVLAQALTVEIIDGHLRAGLVPPVLVSREPQALRREIRAVPYAKCG